jgi:pimeloyl-ACP methyl ester carboxylesterase
VLPHDDLGSGDVVLLLHAGVVDRGMWEEHLGWLQDAGYRVVAVDLPGFGEAPVQPGPQAPWEAVLQTLRELGIDRAAVVGNSFGGAVALRVAALAPAAVSKLMLVSTPPVILDPSPELSAAWEAEESALERGDIDGAVSAVIEAWLQPGAPAELRERVAAMQRRAIELQGAAADVSEAPDPLEQHPEMLERLSMPVLAVAGETDMTDFKQAAEQIAEAVPRGEQKTLAGAGHLAPLEAPDSFRELLLAFLRADE